MNAQLADYDGFSATVPGELIKQGPGTMILTQPNTYTQATIIGAGTLQLGDGTPGDDGSINYTSGVTDNAALVFDLSGSQNASYSITGSGSLCTTGTGTLTLSGTNGYQGGTFVENGTLIAANNEAIGDGTSLFVGSDLSAFGTLISAQAGSAAAMPAVAPVPEPGTLALLGMALCAAAAGSTRSFEMAETIASTGA